MKTPLGTARDGTPIANGTADRMNRDGHLSSKMSGHLFGFGNEEVAEVWCGVHCLS